MLKVLQVGAGRTALAAALGLLLASAAGAQGAHPDISGTWMLAAPAPKALKADNGAAPPLKAEAAALYARRRADKAAGRNQPSGFAACVPPGTPHILLMDRPFMIMQTPRKITFVHEYEHILRHIYLDEPLPKADDTDPTYGGSAVGHWEGGVLVVETADLNDKTDLDSSGLPHSDQLKVTERLHLEGRLLEDKVTIDDPKTYARPWSFRLQFRPAPGVDLKEHNCVAALLPH